MLKTFSTPFFERGVNDFANDCRRGLHKLP